MSKFQRSWVLFKSALSIMLQNRKLLVFPVVVFLVTLLMLPFFLAPVALRPTGHPYISSQHWAAIGHSLFTQTVDAQTKKVETGLTTGAWAWLGLTYFLSMFVATFFNVAFYHEILGALGGQAVSIRQGLRFACTRWKAVLMWTLFAGLVGLIIQQIEQRLSFVGRIIGRFIGMAWSIASIFVIPAIVMDEKNINPIKMLQNSASTLKRTWGEALIGYVGMSLASGLVLIASLFLLGGAFTASMVWNNFWIIGVVGVLWILTMLLLSYVSSVAGQIYKGALYLYAANGIVPEPFSQEMLDSAWKLKKQ